MDLFTTLRVSLYLLVASGAMSVAIAERSLVTLFAVAFAGLTAHITMDRFKFRPLASNLSAIFTVLLLGISLHPLREDAEWPKHFPAAVAHFLILWQALLFFSAYSGPILLTFCGSTLAVVVMSGVMQPGPSLILRLAAFVGLVAWTLYVHAVWRARQEFAGGSTVVTLGSLQERKSPVLEQLPERAFWGSVMLVSGMTLTCMLLGTLFFFSAPRLSWLDYFDWRSKQSLSAPLPVGSGSDNLLSGVGEKVSLKDLGDILLDERVAFSAQFDKPVKEFLGSQKRLLFKALNFASYQDGAWHADKSRRVIDSQRGAPILILDPTSDEALPRKGTQYDVIIEPSANTSDMLFGPGPIMRVISPNSVSIDSEGSLRNGDKSLLVRYEVAVQRWPVCGPRDSAEHPNLSRYVRQHGVSPACEEKLAALALQITHSINSDQEKAKAIARWLNDHCTYSRNVLPADPKTDPLERFLFSRDAKLRSGPCGYFAASFTLLCRFSWMPARLCSGFALNVRDEESNERVVNVRNADAHAWAEIYFKGIGWVPFDPTPAGREREALALQEKKNAAKKTPPPAAPVAEEEKQASTGDTLQDFWNSMMRFDGKAQQDLYKTITGRTATGANESYWGWTGLALLIGGLAGALAATSMLAQFFVRRAARRRLGVNLPSARARAAVAFYNDLLQTLSRRGYTRRSGQTPREFAEAVMKRGGAAFAPVAEVTGIFEAVRYGGGDLDQDEFNRLQEALDRIKEATF